MVDSRQTGLAGKAPLVTVVSASGGVGKSALCLMASHLCARKGINTALVEADLQFGDIGFWLGLDGSVSSLAQGTKAVPLKLKENLSYYKAPTFPEIAESIADEVAMLVSHIRSEYDLVIADTGAFWSGLTADLLVNSSANVLMVDQRPSSVAGAVRAIELCQRIGIPNARRTCVCNRWSQRGRLDLSDVASALTTADPYCVPDGKRIVDELLCAGDVEELVEMENAFAHGVDGLLTRLLPRIGCAYEGVFEQRRRRWTL